LLSSVIDDADHIYRERFLRERYGLDLESVPGVVGDEVDVIDIAEILDDEAGEHGGDASSGEGEEGGEEAK